jgi:hypothetical protein
MVINKELWAGEVAGCSHFFGTYSKLENAKCYVVDDGYWYSFKKIKSNPSICKQCTHNIKN